MTLQQYQNINVSQGQISVERVPRARFWPHCILLVGQTGSGKSTFIECLTGNKSLGISKDQLEGMTQEVMGYRIRGVTCHCGLNIGHSSLRDIILVDTPGFSDDKISELRIINMVRDWIRGTSTFNRFDNILYFDRITDTRMAGSKRKTLEMFKVLAGERCPGCITITTTMWDQIWNDTQIQRAEARFKEMEDVFWQDFVKTGTRIVKFDNTQQSALNVLDECLHASTPILRPFNIEQGGTVARSPYASTVYRALLERVACQQQRLRLLAVDLDQDDTRVDPILERQFLTDRAEVETNLRTLEKELKDFGIPPISTRNTDPDTLCGITTNNNGTVRKNLHKMKQGFKSIMERKDRPFDEERSGGS